MTGARLFVSLRAMLLRWAKRAPALFRHDPLFRYAAIAAVLALIFLAVSMVQDDSRYGTGRDEAPGSRTTRPDRAGQDTTSRTDSAGTGTPPVPRSAAQPDHEDAPAIAPGRSLDSIDVEPAPRDDFGTLPQGETP